MLYHSPTDNIVTRDQLARVPTPAPMGRFHQPYPFSDYVDGIHHALRMNDLDVDSEEYILSHENMRLFGLMELRQGGDTDWRMLLGLRGAHDQRVPRGLVLGTSVMVCSNLCFDGNIAQFKTKQTINIAARLPGMIREAVARVPDMLSIQAEKFDRYKNTTVKPREGDNILVDLFRSGGFSAPQLGRAIQEWHEPTHDEHAELGWSAWRLFNASTEAVKPTGQSTNMFLVEERTTRISEYMNGYVKMAA